MKSATTSLATDDRQAIANPSARNAHRAAAIYIIVTVIIAVASLGSAVASRTTDWQPFVAGLITLGLSAVGGLALRQTRLGNFVRGVHLIIGSFLIGLVLIATLRTGFGPVFGLSAITIALGIGGQTLPSRQVGWMIILAALDAIVVLLIDLYWPFYRSPTPSVLLQFVPALGALTGAFFIYTLIRQFQSYPLQTKLLLTFLIVALLPLAILALSNDSANRESLTKNANQALSSAARQTASNIDNFFASNIATLKVDAQLPNVINFLNLPADIRTAGSLFERTTSDLMVTLSRNGASPTDQSKSSESYFLLDLNGEVVASADRAMLATQAADQDYFKSALQSDQTAPSPINYSGPANAPLFYLSVGVEDSAMQPIGVLVARYDAEVIQQIVAARNGLAGPNSFAVVFDIADKAYIHLAHGTAPAAIGKAVGPLDPVETQKLQAAHRLPAGSSDSLSTNLANLDQQLAQSADQPFFAAEDVATGSAIDQVAVVSVKPPETWLVAFFQPQEVFLQPANEQTQNTVKLALAISVIVAAAAIGVAQLLTGPIVRLTTVATRVTAGDLSARARVETSDEIGAMAEGFNKMTAQLQELIGSLEKRVEARTEQLRASAEVGRAAASILDTERLLRDVVNLITDRFGFYYAAIFLNDAHNKFAVLHEATGSAGRTLKERRHKLEIGGQSMVSGAITTRRPRIALDTGTESVRFANPLLPETRSEIALPLIVGDRTLGALDVQSTQASAFDETYASVLQSMADQIAIAVSNTQQFSQTETALKQTNILYEAGRKIAAANNADSILSALITQAAPDVNHAVLILFGPVDTFGQVNYLETAAVYSDHPTDIKIPAGAHYQPDQLLITGAGTPQEPILIEDFEKADLRTQQTLNTLGVRAVIGLPLSAGSKHLGTLILGYRQPRSFASDTVQILQALASQAAVALQSQHLLAETQAALKQIDVVNRRLTGQAWRDYTMANGTLRVVDAAPGVPSTVASGLIELFADPNQVKAVGPIGDTRSGLIAPIALRGEVVGTLSLQEIDKDREWTENEITLLQTVANDVAVAIENARLIEQTELRAERERVISEVSTRMFAANDLHDIVKVAGEELVRVLRIARTKVNIDGEYLSSTADSVSRDDQHGH